jgi:uncharacterized protein (TIGR00369 family)
MEGWIMDRTRTYSWVNPVELAAAAQNTDGLVFSRQLASGEEGPTPIFATLGYAITEVDHGRAVYVGMPAEHLYNPIGFVHGGFAATMLESAAGSAVHSTVPAGTGYTTLDLSVHYLRPITADTGPIRAIGTLVNRGRRTALAQVELRDPADRLLAHATSSCMLFPPDA